MNGSVFVIGEKGFYCSNDAEMTTERNVIMDDNNKPISSKHTQIIRVHNFMQISGEFEKDDICYCQFKFDSNDEVSTFSCTVISLIQKLLVLNIKARTLHDREVLLTIKNKIKEEINHG